MSGRARCAVFAISLAAALVAGCTFSPELERARQVAPFTPTARPGSGPIHLRTEVVATYPHDPGAFTQGLVLHKGALFESTGRYYRSTLRRVDIVSGLVQQTAELGPIYFGEGLAVVGSRLVQLTWQNGVAFVYDAATLQRLRTLRYSGEGWGLCFDGATLAMSDGTSRLAFRDPETFEVTRAVNVTQDGQGVPLLNELECVGDAVYANVWRTDKIVEISARDGAVRAVVDAAGLLSPADAAGLPADAVLNGIAYDAQTGTFLLTGKLWPKMFRVRFVDGAGRQHPPAKGAT